MSTQGLNDSIRCVVVVDVDVVVVVGVVVVEVDAVVTGVWPDTVAVVLGSGN